MAKKQVNDNRQWYVIDAAGKIVGRSSSVAAKILQGKHKPTYVPRKDSGDHVIIINAEKLVLSGEKATQKRYYHHSGYAGGIKEVSPKELMEKDPRKILVKAVFGMLPRNSMRKGMMKRLHIYNQATHPHQNIQPIEIQGVRIPKK